MKEKKYFLSSLSWLMKPAVRGFHVYRSIWLPKESQVLSCSHEVDDNMYDLFAIKTCIKDESGKEQIVGHLPLELSRVTKYLLDRGAVVTVTLSSTHYRRSVLVQGGLEIPCIVKAKMIATEKNKLILARYYELAKKSYVDVSPEREIIIGSFLDDNQVNSAENISFSVERGIRRKEEKVSTLDKRTSQDIRSFFKTSEETPKTEEGKKTHESEIIIIG